MFWKNVSFIGRIYYRNVKIAFLFLFMSLAGMILQPLLSVYLPRTVVLAVTEGWSAARMTLYAGLFTLGLIGCNLLSTYGTNGYREYCSRGRHGVAVLWLRMLSTCRYELLEDPKWQEKVADAENEVFSDWYNHGLTGFTVSVLQILGSVIGVTTFTVILSKVHFAILLLLVLTAVLTGVLDAKEAEWEQNQRFTWLSHYKKMDYVYNHVTKEEAGKDLRLYEAAGYYLNQFKTACIKRWAAVSKVMRRRFGAKGFGAVMLVIQNGAALGWLVYETAQGRINVAEFTFYAGSVIQFTQFIHQFLQWIGILKRTTLDIQKIRETLEYMPEEQQIEVGLKKVDGGAATKKEMVFEAAPRIQFDHVTFRYPGTDRAILDDVSFTIEAGEKIALVGENGAGKSTIVKLLCGLYQPTSGRILIDDCLLQEMSETSRSALYAVVFQDILVLPLSVMENVSIGQMEDVKRVRDCLEKAGLSERFPNLNVNLVRGSADEAENLSGGEKQKLVLARALYKDAPVLVLDEPTAALDPLAESEMYEKYNELTKNKSAVFISHRLASTRFCSRIMLLGDGKILEVGSHEELLALDGRYAQMFKEQSKYYQEEAEGGELL